MEIYLSDQSKNLSQHLSFLQTQDVRKYDKTKLIEKRTFIEIETKAELDELKTDFFFDYHLFPTHILTHLAQWTVEDRKMCVGDTIVQQAYLPPFRHFSQKIIFGVRINNIIHEPTKIGFSYETLEGHVETGISTFTLEKTQEQGIVFCIHTFSKPGNLLAQFVGPIFSVPYQTYCTRQGLLNVKRQLENHL